MGSDRHRLQELDHSIRNGLSGLALGQGDNGMTMSISDNRIHFLITQALACMCRDPNTFFINIYLGSDKVSRKECFLSVVNNYNLY